MIPTLSLEGRAPARPRCTNSLSRATQVNSPKAPKTVLFLCTGNYYRSRFAEHVFNHHAAMLKLDWRATSRGLSSEVGPWKIGPMSIYALTGLEMRGVDSSGPHREPIHCTESDIISADLVIALKEAE